MLMNIIMGISMYPIMLIMFLVYKNMGLASTKYIFGATLPERLKKCDRIEEIRKEYKKNMRIVFFSTFFIPILAFFTGYISIQFTIWIMWMLLEIVVFIIPFAIANEKVIAFKNENIENDEEDIDKIEYVELRDVRTVHIKDFIVQIIFSIFPVIILFTIKYFKEFKEYTEYQMEQLKVYQYSMLAFAICTILFVITAFWMDKRRTIVINGNSDININYARAKKMVWKRVWVYTSILNTIVIIVVSGVSLMEYHAYLVFIVSVIAEAILAILVVWKGANELGKINDAYEKQFEITTKKDEDRYWKWGLIYYNKSDKRSSVEQRFGIGTTSNMAKTTGKVGALIAFLALAWIPFICGYLIVEDFTPIHISVENQEILCEHTNVYYRIPVNSIEKVELITRLPKSRSKTSGTATDRLEKGNFAVEEYGKVNEFVNPQNGLYICIQTENETYIISGYSDEETKTVYEEVNLITN